MFCIVYHALVFLFCSYTAKSFHKINETIVKVNIFTYEIFYETVQSENIAQPYRIFKSEKSKLYQFNATQ